MLLASAFQQRKYCSQGKVEYSLQTTRKSTSVLLCSVIFVNDQNNVYIASSIASLLEPVMDIITECTH